MTTLSEQDIQRIFLPFLRQFYRYRYEYQPDTEQSSMDNRSADGLVADGLLSFRRPDGSTFLSTFEATSRDKIEEVKYSINHTYFLWDCAAFGAAMAAVAYAWMYAFRLSSLHALSLPGKLGLPIGVALIGFFGWYFIMRNWSKYRYVYAVEQFKRYSADEQWVAIGEDVFPAPTDPYFLELKDQCIYHGFGLAIVHMDQQVRVVAAPSRLGVFGEERRIRHWITQNEWYQYVSSQARAASQYQPPGVLPKLGRTIMRPIQQFVVQPIRNALGSKVVNPTTQAYQRFTGEHLVQKWVCTVATVLVATFTYQAAQYQPEREATERADVFRPVENDPPPSPERQNKYVVGEDEQPVPFEPTYSTQYYNGVPRQDPNSRPSAEDKLAKSPEQYTQPRPQAQRDQEAAAPRSDISTSKTTTTTPKSAATGSLCSRIKSAGGWIVQDNVFSTAAYANDRIKALRKAGISADAFEADCLGDKGWIVRLGYNQYSERTARDKAADYESRIQKAGLRTGKVIVRRIE
jgi:cell division septation protein DedD